MRSVTASLLLACAALIRADRFETLNIANGDAFLDGFHRQAITVNGSTPGPILSATKGEDLYVTVNNRLTDHSMNLTTTVHWHGIFQPRTAYDDGPAFVTQCPIASGHSYRYKIETGHQAGTFWYHSHQTSQYVDGLRGALIIRDPENDVHKDLYDVDDDSTVISLTDWYHQPSQILLHHYLTTPNVTEPVPDSNLFNGVGRYNNASKDATSIPERPVINVEKGKRYRFRVINMSATVAFNFGIQGHMLKVIEVDGVSHKEYDVTSLEIAAGQRYSIVVTANGDETKNYWIAYPGRPDVEVEANPNYNTTEAFAVLRYNKAPQAEPAGSFTPDNTKPLKEFELRSLEPFVPPTNSTPFKLDLRFGFDGNTQRYNINGTTFEPPDMNLLYDILHSNSTPTQEEYNKKGIYIVPHDSVVEVRIVGGPHHPFHLHGHTFQVIQSAEGANYTGNDAPMRDTVDTNGVRPNPDGSVPSPGPVTFRFRTDNPGPWFLHCHKDWHLEAGLAVVFVEDPAHMREGPDKLTPPPEWDELCKEYRALDPKDH